jgi:hypothetical protein
MEVQPDIQQHSVLDQASSLGASFHGLRHRTRGLQLIQRSELLVSTASRTDPPSTFCCRRHPVCPPQADYVRVE